MTTLHAGGKFSDKAYQTAGGLHGVGISVVAALSERVEVEVARERMLWAQAYERGVPQGPVQKIGAVPNRRGTRIRFKPDAEIFGPRLHFKPARLFAMARAKAYLRRGIEIRWRCPEAMVAGTETPAEAVLSFPGGLADRLKELTEGANLVAEAFSGRVERDGRMGAVEWAVAFSANGFGEHDGFSHSYCNTVPTPQGGTHEQGLRAAISKGLKAYADLSNIKKAGQITPDDVMGGAGAVVSIFLRDPEFQGQTKDRLATAEAQRIVEQGVKDAFDHWLAGNPQQANKLLDFVVERAEERVRRRQEKEISRKTAVRKLRLPGKLADCTRSDSTGTEIFLVEGDSAGGSAKQARDREFQAIMPLRGKILNTWEVESGEILASQEVHDISVALGIDPGSSDLEDLRYHKICILADADSDGLHIATLLCALFVRHFRTLVERGHIYVAMPPLYRIDVGKEVYYALDEAEKNGVLDRIAAEGKKGKVNVQRFKGLGEMNPLQLRETTMAVDTRRLVQLTIDGGDDTLQVMDMLLAKKRAGDRKTWLEEKGNLAEVAL
jgi:topoisomerase IV subunit B